MVYSKCQSKSGLAMIHNAADYLQIVHLESYLFWITLFLSAGNSRYRQVAKSANWIMLANNKYLRDVLLILITRALFRYNPEVKTLYVKRMRAVSLLFLVGRAKIKNWCLIWTGFIWVDALKQTGGHAIIWIVQQKLSEILHHSRDYWSTRSYASTVTE